MAFVRTRVFFGYFVFLRVVVRIFGFKTLAVACPTGWAKHSA